MANFVLVHGAWHGGWCWRGVADRLRSAGHRVATPTLTGLGERRHLLGEQVNLDTHIEDVVNAARWEEFDRFVLCGHSYGGAVITGVAERLESAPGAAIGAIVYLDAFIPGDGQSVAAAAGLQAPEAPTLAPPAAESFQIRDPRDRAWVDAMMTPHPMRTITQPQRVSGAYDRIPRKVYVLAAAYDRGTQAFRSTYARLSGDASWKTFARPHGHHLMLDDPDFVVETLLEAAL